MNLVVLCGSGPINTCLINLVAKQHPVRHAFRVVWDAHDLNNSRWSNLAHSPIRTIQTTVRRRFYNWLERRIESQATRYLMARGVSTTSSAPFSSIDLLKINTEEFAQSLRDLETDVLLVSACPLLET